MNGKPLLPSLNSSHSSLLHHLCLPLLTSFCMFCNLSLALYV
ncbi:hypothetical protein SLEP1_g1519 [Rubroshorea leprosula]|uniref:Uncharacterized protein n=1 Tax=Rubroshorea leprosula TaxID=152421 RepID=A0AAV5HPH2_9ROSI|nr:hypothetical protein SLEP1_g1519 [Rubroshorea leprosula]